MYLIKKAKQFLNEVGGMTILFLQTIYWTIRNIRSGKFDVKGLIDQMAHIGVDSVLMVCITGVSVGAVLVVQIGYQFAQMGAQGYVGGVVALAMAREMAPILTSIVVAGRVGSSIAAELGTMKITEQIDALDTLATNPVDYLVVPRFWACTIMLVMLTVLVNVVGMIGGAVVAVYQIDLTLESFTNSVLEWLRVYDLFGGLFKAMVFGAIIAIIGCFKGFTTSGGAEGVGKSTTDSVVVAIMMILAVNYFLTVFISNLNSIIF
ncbi:MAG: ABC transporter permease [Candidatus Riflebacteria bacterium]|nr:ABC transporter permease [Candidatus Riflebacteria bacterium]